MSEQIGNQFNYLVRKSHTSTVFFLTDLRS